jgi:uncharacterized protein YegP (UPF0339 family)
MSKYRIVQDGDGQFMAQIKAWFIWMNMAPRWFQTQGEAKKLIEKRRKNSLPYRVVEELEV